MRVFLLAAGLTLGLMFLVLVLFAVADMRATLAMPVMASDSENHNRDWPASPQSGADAGALDGSILYVPLVMRSPGLPPPLFGVQMYDTVTYSVGITWLTEAEVQWLRVPVNWNWVEPTNRMPEDYVWTQMDAQIGAVTGEGMEPLITLAGNPRWASIYPMGPVTDLADLQEFMGALVERYDADGYNDAPGSPMVRYWEIYNEPDATNEQAALGGGYALFGYNGAGYAELLDAVYPVVKAASPHAQLVFGGVAHDNFDYEGGGFDPNFVDDVLENCTTACFDIMNFHYYPFYRWRWEPYGRDVLGKLNYLREKLASYGFERPFMCTESTWPEAMSWGSNQLQVNYVPALYTRAVAGGLLTQVWFAWRDVDSSLPGLLNNSFQPKPAYYAYQVLLSQLGEARFVRTLSSADTGSVDIEGYEFQVHTSQGIVRRDIVWLDCPSLRTSPPQGCPGSSQTMSVAANMVKVTDALGAVVFVNGSNGQVVLTITSSPVYLEYNP